MKTAIATVFGALLIAVATPLTLPAPAEAAVGGKCVRLQRTAAGERLVNACSACRMASVIRSRVGSDVPISRKFSLHGHSAFALPFKGPGRTRITADLPCKGSAEAAPNLVDDGTVARAQRKCVQMQRGRLGGIVLTNGCGSCRVAAIERSDRTGLRKVRDAVTVPSGAVIQVRSNGFDRVGVLGDLPCRRK